MFFDFILSTVSCDFVVQLFHEIFHGKAPKPLQCWPYQMIYLHSQNLRNTIIYMFQRGQRTCGNNQRRGNECKTTLRKCFPPRYWRETECFWANEFPNAWWYACDGCYVGILQVSLNSFHFWVKTDLGSLNWMLVTKLLFS